MTERSGTRTGWRAAAMVAPAAAVLFAGTTAWAQRNAPAAGGNANPPAGQAADGPPGTDTGLRAAIAADERRLADLQRRLDALAAQAKAKGCGTTLPTISPAPGRQAALPAPPAHTTTGASGARR